MDNKSLGKLKKEVFSISISNAIAIVNVNIIFAPFFIVNTSLILTLAKEPFYINCS